MSFMKVGGKAVIPFALLFILIVTSPTFSCSSIGFILKTKKFASNMKKTLNNVSKIVPWSLSPNLSERCQRLPRDIGILLTIGDGGADHKSKYYNDLYKSAGSVIHYYVTELDEFLLKLGKF